MTTKLTRRRPESLAERYRDFLEREGDLPFRAEIVPAAHLPALREELIAAVQPAPREEVAKAIAVLFNSFKLGGQVDNPKAYTLAMIAELAGYPADVLPKAVREARRTLKWTPAIAEMVQICDGLMRPRWNALRALQKMENESQRRAEEAEKRAGWERRNRAELADMAAREAELFERAAAELAAQGKPPAEVADTLTGLRTWPDDSLNRARLRILAEAGRARSTSADMDAKAAAAE